jgi:hypothetical protein
VRAVCTYQTGEGHICCQHEGLRRTLGVMTKLLGAIVDIPSTTDLQALACGVMTVYRCADIDTVSERA